MLIAATYQEIINSESPASVGFSQEGGRAQTLYLCDTEDLTDVIEDLLGYTETRVIDGGLPRHLPRAHPRFPWLYVERISNIQGLGKPTKVGSSPNVEAPGVEFGTSYPKYRLTVEFMPRPYAVLPDSAAPRGSIDWFDENGDAASEEWRRFTEIEYLPSVELITAQQGQMVLRTGDFLEPNEKSFPGQPQIRLPRAVVRVRWYQVPYRYISSENSNLRRFLGRINQNTWNGFAAGSLLYDSFTAKRYTPPFPDTVVLDTGGTAFSADKLCDVEMIFHEVQRSTPSAPTPTNANWVAAGHNLLPWFGNRKFYYATAFDPSNQADADGWVPPYLSFPLELLFTDPDF